MNKLDIPLSKAIKTTAFHLRRLKELNIETVEDFLTYFPRRYTDQREVREILDIQINEANTVRGTIKSIKNSPTWRRRMSVTTALISDKSASVKAVWFNQPYIGKTLKTGIEIMISGKAKYDPKKGGIFFQNPAFELVKENQIHTARIVPVYHETDLNTEKRVRGKISSKWIREKLFILLPFADDFPEFLPPEIRKKYKLIKRSEAIKNAHFPKSETALSSSKHRLAFDELFLLQLSALQRKYFWRKQASRTQKQIKPDWDLIKKFIQSFTWSLTNAQKKAIYEIIKDTSNNFPMSRLLEGDTGSGKTVVAAAAILHTIKANWQACLLAPTEILAFQHHKTLSSLLDNFGIKPVLLVGSTPEKEKREIIEKLKKGEIQLIVGTHALIQERISFARLGLAVIDEQHRFGVKQREMLKKFNGPHILSLTATPIPRTLALILYGDQDLSVLDEMPPTRQKVITRIVPEEKRREAYNWIQNEIKNNRQAFIIFPLIDESPALQIKAAAKEFEILSAEVFPNLKIGLLHGQLPPKEKEAVMRDFAEGKTQILVSTAVVEVGVDVPNATIMMIEGAERFGLAQLHQFRGRVGRPQKSGAKSYESYCFLFPSSQNPQNLKRLSALVKYDSGFKLAQIDLQLRGPGEVYGTAQSGIPDLIMANLSDAITIKESREAAEKIIEIDPDLKNHQTLAEKIAEQENIAIDY